MFLPVMKHLTSKQDMVETIGDHKQELTHMCLFELYAPS